MKNKKLTRHFLLCKVRATGLLELSISRVDVPTINDIKAILKHYFGEYFSYFRSVAVVNRCNTYSLYMHMFFAKACPLQHLFLSKNVDGAVYLFTIEKIKVCICLRITIYWDILWDIFLWLWMGFVNSKIRTFLTDS